MFWSDKSPPIDILPSANWKMTLWTNVALFFSFRNPVFTQFVLSTHRPGMLGRWWILRQYCTTSTRTKGEMRRRSCAMLAVPVQTAKPATVTAKPTALTIVLCPHQARKRSMRYVLPRDEPSHSVLFSQHSPLFLSFFVFLFICFYFLLFFCACMLLRHCNFPIVG